MINRIINIGINDTIDLYQKKETRLLNLFVIIILSSILLCFINIVFTEGIYQILLELALVAFSLLVLYLNFKRKYNFSLYTFVLGINAALLYINIRFDSAMGNYLYYFPILFCTTLLHNPKKPIYRTVLMFSMIAASMIGAFLLHGKLIPIVAANPEQSAFLLPFNIYTSVILTLVVVGLIVSQLNKQHMEFTGLVAQINSDKVTIKSSLEEKEVLLAEVQHRVKNNLSVIIGLFNLQMDQTQNEDYRNLLTEAKNRVLSIAMVHQKIYKKDDLSKINLSNYVSDLVQEIVRSHSLKDSIHVYEDLNNIDASVTTAVPIGLIVNEVITNSLKHAFNHKNKNCILKVSLAVLFDKLILKIVDNGNGFPENYDKQNRSIGLTLINSLSEQLDGEVFFRNENGAVVELSIPVG